MDIEQRANEILGIQRDAVENLKVSREIVEAVNKIKEMHDSNGRIITTGMGKAGIIAFKMSATLSSIGLPSFHVHPGEAAHGDLGRIMPDDLIIVFSNSGKTSEVIAMINHLHALNDGKNFVICIGSNSDPEISHDLAISYGSVKESCVVSKVPSTSTTLMLIIADILAITAAESLGLSDEWFKIRHPGGAIGESYKKK
ncbi:MAG: SIS domain-containing protein [Promethearchaeota archaeon]